MLFRAVALCFIQLRSLSSRKEMISCLAELLTKASPEEAKCIVYFVLGELRPPFEGTRFNLAERLLIRVIAQVLQRSEQDIKQHTMQIGDVGDVIEQEHWDGSEKMTVLQIYEILCMIEQLHGTGSIDARIRALTYLLQSISSEEAALVIRIINGSLRLGVSEMTVIDAISWMVSQNNHYREVLERAYNICADVGRIVARVKVGGIEDMHHVHIIPGVPIRPAAAERLNNAQEIMEKLGPCVAQPKLDGFRVQVHIIVEHGISLKFFSRNLQRMDDMFPEFVAALQTWQGSSCILEGEAVAYDDATGQLLPFQETVRRRRKHDVNISAQEYPLKLVLFDVLYARGHATLHMPHSKRYALLQELIVPLQSSTISVIEECAMTTAQALNDYFLEAVARGFEGLVVKRDDALYQAGKRNFNWIKLKRQRIGHLEDTIDAVIIGYYAGRGKRARFGIGALLVAVYNQSKDVFETVAKIGTGLSDDEWVMMKSACDKKVVMHRPINVVVASEIEPDVWIFPEYVVEIAADEITLSPTHTAGKTGKHQAGLALRFPRIVGIRTDKSALDATTIHELQELYQAQRSFD